MTKFYKRTLWTLGIALLVIASIFFWSRVSNYLDSALCDNQFIKATDSPDSSKKVVVFSTDCGATTDFAIHASVLKKDQNIDDTSLGNAMRLDSNHGSAWPRDDQGRPIIKAVWNGPNSLTLYYSSNSDVFYQKSEVDDVQITFASLTQP